MGKTKDGRRLQKSVYLNDTEWAIIGKLAQRPGMTNNKVLSFMIESYVFLTQLLRVDKAALNLYVEFLGNIKQADFLFNEKLETESKPLDKMTLEELREAYPPLILTPTLKYIMMRNYHYKEATKIPYDENFALEIEEIIKDSNLTIDERYKKTIEIIYKRDKEIKE